MVMVHGIYPSVVIGCGLVSKCWSVVTRLSTKWSAVEAGLSRHTPLYANLTSLGKSAAACFSRREERFALKVARKAKFSLNNPALEFSLKKERSCRIFNITLKLTASCIY